MTGKEEKERYTQLNEEFQRIARRDRKAFLSDQCKETEENNKMGNTRDLFKKTGVTKGTFHTKIGTIKDKNSKELKKQKNLRRGGKNTQTDILECEVKWALGSITTSKASGGGRVPAELFKILKKSCL